MKICSYKKDEVIICNDCGKWNGSVPCCRCGNSVAFKIRRVRISYHFSLFPFSICKNVKLYLPYADPTRVYEKLCEQFRYLRYCEVNDASTLQDSYRIGSRAILCGLKQLRDSYWKNSEDKGLWHRLGKLNFGN